MHHQTTPALLRLMARGVVDAVGGLLGRPPMLVPLAGEAGPVALLTTPQSREGADALNPHDRYPTWQQAVAARSAFELSLYRPGRSGSAIRCPLLVTACDQDESALAEPAVRAAQRAPRGEVLRLPGGHYAPFKERHEETVQAELAFLRRHLLTPSGADAAVGSAAS
jgi:pimeloyl-ACP methyl ester carboxylesterase